MHAIKTMGALFAAALLAATVAVAQTGGAAGAGAGGDDGGASVGGGVPSDDDVDSGARGTANDDALRGTNRPDTGGAESEEGQQRPEDDLGETNDDAGPTD
jgi:hypothetical protein